MIDRLLTPMLIPTIGNLSIPRNDAVDATRSFEAWLQEPASAEPLELESPMPSSEPGDQVIEQWFFVDQVPAAPDPLASSEPGDQAIEQRLFVDQVPTAPLPLASSEPELMDRPADPIQLAPDPRNYLSPLAAVKAALVSPAIHEDSAPVSREISSAIARPIEGRQAQFVSVPWRLMAGKGLSYLGVGPAQEVLSPVSPPELAHTVPLSAPLRAQNGPPLAPGYSNLRQWQRGDEDQEKVRSVVTIAETIAETTPTDPLLRAGNDWTRSPVWLQRLLRWQGDAEETTAWVRDFQLDPKAASSLVDSLQQLARQQNLTLRRIVLNGHEIWRSTIQRKPSGSQ